MRSRAVMAQHRAPSALSLRLINCIRIESNQISFPRQLVAYFDRHFFYFSGLFWVDYEIERPITRLRRCGSPFHSGPRQERKFRASCRQNNLMKNKAGRFSARNRSFVFGSWGLVASGQFISRCSRRREG
jgi:hypothetical protein